MRSTSLNVSMEDTHHGLTNLLLDKGGRHSCRGIRVQLASSSRGCRRSLLLLLLLLLRGRNRGMLLAGRLHSALPGCRLGDRLATSGNRSSRQRPPRLHCC